MFKNLLLMLMLCVFSSTASASMVLVGLYNGFNDGDATELANILDTEIDEISGSAIGFNDIPQEEARVNWVTDNTNPQDSGGLSITATVFKSPPNGDEAIAGTWDWTGAGSLDYLTIKFDSWLAVYEITDGMTSGTWSTEAFCTAPDFLACNSNNKPFSLSHSTAYSVVPVPAAVWLFGSGLLGLVGIARRKSA